MLKSFVLAAALLVPSLASAQLQMQTTNFANTSNGFTATVLFRNTNQYGDPNIVALTDYFLVKQAPSLQAFCATVYACNIFGANGTTVGSVGNVQQTSFTRNGQLFAQDGGYNEEGCQVLQCQSTVYDHLGGLGVLGCQAPGASSGGPLMFIARTCAADGFDGWLSFNVRFIYGTRDGSPLATAPVFTANDFAFAYNTRVLAGPSVLVTPEPATYALLAFGLGVVGVVAKRRRVA